MSRPPDVHIDDLGDPVLPDGFAEQIEAVEPLVAGLDFTSQGLCKQASQETGLWNFGNDDFRERLDLIIRGFKTEAKLHALGLLSRHGILLRYLKNRLLLEDLYDRHPEIDEVAVERPIIIAGLPRTGTTHLLNLISADPNMRSLPYWEALEPVLGEHEKPAPGEPDPRLARCQAACDATNGMMPYFKRMHEMTVDHTHEEIDLLAIDFSTMYFENMGYMPSWVSYYLGHDQTPHYTYLKRILKALQWLRGGTRWILKSPQHLEQIQPIRNVFPDATLVFTHRDPVAIVASFATLAAYGARLSDAEIDLAEVGDYWAKRIAKLLQATVDDRELAPATSSIDVLFHDFMADDVATVARIYELAGQPLPDRSVVALERYMVDHPRGRHGRVLYDLADFDLDAGDLRERFRFYTNRFPVQLES
jgi:hypothetical protein